MSDGEKASYRKIHRRNRIVFGFFSALSSGVDSASDLQRDLERGKDGAGSSERTVRREDRLTPRSCRTCGRNHASRMTICAMSCVRRRSG
jgi:hypothetical protein